MLIRIIAIFAGVAATLTAQQLFEFNGFGAAILGLLAYATVRAGAWALRVASRQLVAHRAKRRSKFNVADIALLIS